MEQLHNINDELNYWLLERAKDLKGKYLKFEEKDSSPENKWFITFVEDIFLKEKTKSINIKSRRVNKEGQLEKYPSNFNIQDLNFKHFNIFVFYDKDEMINSLMLDKL